MDLFYSKRDFGVIVLFFLRKILFLQVSLFQKPRCCRETMATKKGLFNKVLLKSGPQWTRTTDLTLIRGAL